ncbi:MAG: hypothetical protein AB1589_35140 [Cyanobacteriota bacterium]
MTEQISVTDFQKIRDHLESLLDKRLASRYSEKDVMGYYLSGDDNGKPLRYSPHVELLDDTVRIYWHQQDGDQYRYVTSYADFMALVSEIAVKAKP